jgi:O-antigen ligase
MLKKLNQILWGAFLFTFPFSIRFILYEDASYRFGNFNPFVTGFLYLPEILLGIVFVLWVISKFKMKNMNPKSEIRNPKWLLLILFLLNAGVVTFIKGDAVLFGFFLLRIIEAIIIYLLIIDQLLPIKTIIKILLVGALFQLIWGWTQWKLNHSLGLTWLGESVIGSDVMGVAKIDLADGAKQIRPYGSFLHPNILATYLMVIMFISLSYLKKYHLLFWLIILTGGIYFTHSRAAAFVTLIGFGLVVLFSFIKDLRTKKNISLLILLIFFLGNAWFLQKSQSINVRDISWQERLEQNVVSHDMFWKNPLGVGIRNFTLEMEKYGNDKFMPWEFQPVHNSYFLVLNETGIQGLVLLLIAIVLIFYIYWKQGSIIPLILLILIAPFDHFLWDSFVGIILVAIVLGVLRLQQTTD